MLKGSVPSLRVMSVCVLLLKPLEVFWIGFIFTDKMLVAAWNSVGFFPNCFRLGRMIRHLILIPGVLSICVLIFLTTWIIFTALTLFCWIWESEILALLNSLKYCEDPQKGDGICTSPHILLVLLSCKGCGINPAILTDTRGPILCLRKPGFLNAAADVFAHFMVSKVNSVVFAGILCVCYGNSLPVSSFLKIEV